MNKVKFNLLNVYYAMLTLAEDGTPTWAKPVAIPGAVSLSMDPQGDTEEFYADGIKYYISTNNEGYSCSLEIAEIPQSYRVEALGEVEDEKGILIENSRIETKEHALLFQFDGDAKEILHVMYQCKAERPKIEGKTNEKTKSIQTDTLNLTSTPLKDGQVKSKTGDKADKDVREKWFDAVYYNSNPKAA